MQNAERERLIRQMSTTPEPRVAVIAKTLVCVGVLGALVAAGIEITVPAPTLAIVERPVSHGPADARAEVHRKHVFDARRQYAAERGGRDAEQDPRVANTAP
jgi:hypothetical protein